MNYAPLDWQIRVKAALILMLIELLSILALNATPRDDSYYLVCGAFNLMIIWLLPAASNVGLIADLQRINFIALCFQAFGFISYWLSIPIYYYNFAIHALNFIQIMRLLITRQGDADGLGEDCSWLSVVRNYYLHSHKIMSQKEKS